MPASGPSEQIKRLPRRDDGSLALRGILAQKDGIDELESQKSELDDETEKIFYDQQRLRENMKALKGSPDEEALLQRNSGQLNEQENRLDTLPREIKRRKTSIDAAKVALDKAIQGLAFDERLCSEKLSSAWEPPGSPQLL